MIAHRASRLATVVRCAMLLRATLFALALGASGCAHRDLVPTPPPLPYTNSTDDTHHAPLRLTSGARPGDVERIEAMTLERWLDEQLAPAS